MRGLERPESSIQMNADSRDYREELKRETRQDELRYFVVAVAYGANRSDQLADVVAHGRDRPAWDMINRRARRQPSWLGSQVELLSSLGTR